MLAGHAHGGGGKLGGLHHEERQRFHRLQLQLHIQIGNLADQVLNQPTKDTALPLHQQQPCHYQPVL